MKGLVIIVVFIISINICFAQKHYIISGYVYDENSNEVLIGANIIDIKTHKGTVSNRYGFYSVTLPIKDTISLMVSFIGYKAKNINITPNSNKKIDIFLQSGIEINEVKVIGHKTNRIVERNETSVIRLQMKETKSLPNLFGEADIMKTLQLMPGVQSGGEAKSSLYVRGGSPDQNLILLDDVPLYYVSHFGGMFSIFNADAINDVKLIKGGFPARYGSRLSSVLDIRMKEGNKQKFCTQGTIGLLSSKISTEGPITKNETSFIISARKNIIPVFYFFDMGISYDFYDINAKINHNLTENDKLFLSIYSGNDIVKVKNKIKNASISEKDVKSVKWGNTLVALRWNHIFSPKLFSNLTLSYTNYRYQNVFELSYSSDSINKDYRNKLYSGIKDINLKYDFDFYAKPNIKIRYGLNSIYHMFTPNDIYYFQEGTDISYVDTTYNSIKENALENALYFESEFKFNWFNTNLGVRFSSYNIKNQNYYSIEPRILLNFILCKNLSLKYSFSKMNQYVHLLSYSGVGMPSDFWMPTTKNVVPEISYQNTIGIAQSLFEDKFEFSIESYYKTMNNLITFKKGESFFGSTDNWENIIEKNGTGNSYGLELFLQKLEGKTTGWIGFTLSKADRKFDNLNNAEVFPFKYDRRYDIGMAIIHKIKENINFSATWTYGSGYPITIATEKYTASGEDVYVFDEINSFRMRDYHRLDIGVNFNKKTKWGERTWTVSIFNVYNRQNPYFYYYDRELIDMINTCTDGYCIEPVYSELKLYQQSLYPFFPSFSYSFKF
ncbi:MAG: TonB-dependent receptor [Bacteroidales bacterium]|nr:TonB-dependent receptor [Bacteroidales bacterium]